MQTDTLKCEAIRYNPEWAAFETVVELREAGGVYAYPVHLPGPLTADYAWVTTGLLERARAIHRTGRSGLRMRRGTPVLSRAA
jgi:hypothetical protein